MRARYPLTTVPSEAAEFEDDIRRAFQDLGKSVGAESLIGECMPAVDVYESDDAVEIVVDVPGVDPSAIRVLARRDTVLILGEKAARRARAESSFRLVEREFGRFVRTVRVLRACDTSRGRAELADGELRITLPKIVDRRGHTVRIPITLSRSRS
jgi:HSP20 family protein